MTDSTPINVSKRHIKTIEMRNITKRFPGVLANDRVDLNVAAGEILALLGENGAGKSTLMKILYGLYKPDGGEILINGKVVSNRTPQEAIQNGIGMIHQHFMLVDNFTVAENVALGIPAKGLKLDLETVSKKITALSDEYNLEVDPTAIISDLAVGQQQRVEIIKALVYGADLLILDEPTAVLTPQEVDNLFDILRKMAAQGHSLIFISHKLHEIIDLTDSVMVLRDGKLIGHAVTSEVTKNDLAAMMVGRDVSFERELVDVELGDVRLKLDGVSLKNSNGTRALHNVTFEINGGEILGVAGVSGNGQRQLAEVIAGLQIASSGNVMMDGKDVTHLPPVALIEAGLSYIPEERMHDGVVKSFSCAENLILQDHVREPYSKRSFLDFKYIANHADEMIAKFDVKTPTRETPIKNLSGGNIQKLILARELDRQPRVLIAAQPTRGVDIGAMEFIHEQLLAQRATGLATILLSEDLDEVFNLSDRIMVMFHGEVMGIVRKDETTPEAVGLMMAGERIINN